MYSYVNNFTLQEDIWKNKAFIVQSEADKWRSLWS